VSLQNHTTHNAHTQRSLEKMTKILHLFHDGLMNVQSIERRPTIKMVVGRVLVGLILRIVLADSLSACRVFFSLPARVINIASTKLS